MGTPRPPLSPGTPATLTYQTTAEQARAVRIAFSGEIDMSTSDQLDAAITEALRSHGLVHVCLDLAEVRFIDSSGINVLMRCYARAADSGRRLTVTNPQPIVYRVLEITGVLEPLTAKPATAD